MPKTTGEEALVGLARASFLRPWTFPNLFYRKGKELADLIIRYDDAIIIVSEKGKTFNNMVDPINGWFQWKSVINHSIRQIKGAERQITTQDPVFYLDARCRTRAPRHLFSDPAKRIFRIAVVRGSGLATQRFFRSNTGSLLVSSDRCGAESNIPFSYNPHDSNGLIYHVLDDYTFQMLFKHIDTAPDLIKYLQEKEALLNSLDRFDCHGEEELVQHYLRNVGSDGEHGFAKIIDHAIKNQANFILFSEDSFADFEIHHELVVKKADDRPSYAVDRFIDYIFETFVDDHPEVAPRVERALRQLASMNRVERRMLGAHILEVAQMHPQRPIFARAQFSGKTLDEAKSATVIMLIEIRENFHPNPLIASEINNFVVEIAKCYVAKISRKASNVTDFSIIIFVRDTRGNPVLYSEALSHVSNLDVTEEFLDHYISLADDLKIGQFKGPIRHQFEKEYRGEDLN